MSEVLKEIPEAVINEKGMIPEGVAIWKRGTPIGDQYHHGTVGEFLSDPNNQHGVC